MMFSMMRTMNKLLYHYRNFTVKDDMPILRCKGGRPFDPTPSTGWGPGPHRPVPLTFSGPGFRSRDFKVKNLGLEEE
jgi:hypothetical protein